MKKYRIVGDLRSGEKKGKEKEGEHVKENMHLLSQISRMCEIRDVKYNKLCKQ
jgi:hypothetical protein